MIPYDLEIAKVERGGLGVGDIGLAGPVYEDAAGRTDFAWRAQLEHPSHHIEHVNAHVSDDAVAVLRESAPTPWVSPLAVRPHWRRPGPHLIIESFRRRGVRRVALRAHMPVTANFHMGNFAELAFPDDAVARFD